MSRDTPVTLITHADLDAGYRLALELLGSGHRVVVTSRHPSELTRIVHGFATDQVFAIAADPDDDRQLARILRRSQDRLGRVTRMIDARVIGATNWGAAA